MPPTTCSTTCSQVRTRAATAPVPGARPGACTGKVRTPRVRSRRRLGAGSSPHNCVARYNRSGDGRRPDCAKRTQRRSGSSPQDRDRRHDRSPPATAAVAARDGARPGACTRARSATKRTQRPRRRPRSPPIKAPAVRRSNPTATLRNEPTLKRTQGRDAPDDQVGDVAPVQPGTLSGTSTGYPATGRPSRRRRAPCNGERAGATRNEANGVAPTCSPTCTQVSAIGPPICYAPVLEATPWPGRSGGPSQYAPQSRGSAVDVEHHDPAALRCR